MDTNASNAAGTPLTRRIWNVLQAEPWFGLLDVALVATALFMLLTNAVVLFFHVIFLLLTFGAFYWKLRAFVLRAALWVSLTTAIVLTAILSGQTQVEELSEIPLLTAILVLVFIIAQQRARAEESLRRANEELEERVAERTAELTQVNERLSREIAEHRQTERTLRESEERYRRLVELSFEAIAIHSEGKLVYVNPPGAKLLGASSPEELIGRPIRDLVHPDYWDLLDIRVQQLEEGKGVPLVEERFIRLDGTLVDVEVASVPITYQGQPAVQTVIHDITARKQAEAERERERARIARDLHSSLGHNLGYLHLKLDEMTGNEALKEIVGVRRDLTQMRQAANEAYEMVRSMLAASLPANTTDLATALLIQARSVGQRGNFEVQLTSDGQPRPLSPVVQQQVLYLFQEALINVEKHAQARQVAISLAWAEEALTITLSDDGCGFEVGTPQVARGYGLTIMQDRAQEINGRLSLISHPGAGTKVILRLPLN